MSRSSAACWACLCLAAGGGGVANAVAAGPDLAVESVALTARAEGRVQYVATVRNVGDEPLPDDALVTMQAWIAPGRTIGRGSGAQGAGGFGDRTFAGLAPGAVRTTSHWATRRGDDLPFLIVELRRSADPDQGNNLGVVSLAAPLVPAAAEPPTDDSDGEANRPPRPNAVESPPRFAGGTPWAGVLFFVLFAAFVLGFMGLVALMFVEALRPGRRLPRRFGAGDDSAPNDLAEAARALRFEPDDALPARLRIALQSTLGASPDGPAFVRRTRQGVYLLCNTRREQTRDSQNSSSLRTVVTRATALAFSAEPRGSARFPPFAASPNRKPNGLLTQLYRRFFGGLRFPEDPEFDQKILLGTAVPEAVRPLMTAAVRDSLKENEEFTVVASGETLAVSCGVERSRGLRFGSRLGRGGTHLVSEPIRVEDWPAFAAAAAGLIQTVRRAERETRSLRPDAATTARQTAAFASRWAFAAGAPGSGSVPQAEIDGFLQDPPPRRLPASIRRAARDQFGCWFQLIGAFFIVLPVGLAAVLWNQLMLETGTALVGLLPAAFAVLGAAMFGWPTWQALRRRGLLRHGTAVRATVAAVRRGGVTLTSGSASYEQYRVTFAYEIDGDRCTTALSLYGDQARRATILEETGDPTRLLVDRDRPTRAFWIDGLAVD